MFPEQGGWSYARHLQELRRLKHSGRDDDLSLGSQEEGGAGGGDAHARGDFVLVEDDALGQRAVEHVQVGPLPIRTQICSVGRGSEAVGLVDRRDMPRRPVQGSAQETVGFLDADPLESDAHPGGKAIGICGIGDIQGASRAEQRWIVGRRRVGEPRVAGRREVAGLVVELGDIVKSPGRIAHLVGPFVMCSSGRNFPGHGV